MELKILPADTKEVKLNFVIKTIIGPGVMVNSRGINRSPKFTYHDEFKISLGGTEHDILITKYDSLKMIKFIVQNEVAFSSICFNTINNKIDYNSSSYNAIDMIKYNKNLEDFIFKYCRNICLM
ncbi:MAG: hypothetical protein LC122_12450 [Chitinophagales bacterium]|nr:hypothetical protein [Chitinophagales bacterium]